MRKQDYEEEEYELRECSESSCGHFDSLNQCCWLSWRDKEEGDPCDYNFSTQPYGDFLITTK